MGLLQILCADVRAQVMETMNYVSLGLLPYKNMLVALLECIPAVIPLACYDDNILEVSLSSFVLYIENPELLV